MSIPDALAVLITPVQGLRSGGGGDAVQGAAASASVGLVARWCNDPRPTASWNLERR
ncbi:hypothetical protein LWC33_32205 [Pseudonocardia sp. RS11V-5]|uniref:hypothetical protein n=1 Tax=Pseudonocardia terrae TaxID=2905831 RepID=UPI001E48BE6A|nr:hypothetical protein [Pseudonocardia terrae]MCE3556092.1 hypothetical protein [Pseudonocardia terrae]